MSGSDFAMTKGEQVRDFIYVKDVAKSFVSALKFENILPGNPIIQNIGTGCPQTVLEFSEYWWKKWRARGDLLVGHKQYRDNEVMRYVPQI